MSYFQTYDLLADEPDADELATADDASAWGTDDTFLNTVYGVAQGIGSAFADFDWGDGPSGFAFSMDFSAGFSMLADLGSAGVNVLPFEGEAWSPGGLPDDTDAEWGMPEDEALDGDAEDEGLAGDAGAPTIDDALICICWPPNFDQVTPWDVPMPVDDSGLADDGWLFAWDEVWADAWGAWDETWDEAWDETWDEAWDETWDETWDDAGGEDAAQAEGGMDGEDAEVGLDTLVEIDDVVELIGDDVVLEPADYGAMDGVESPRERFASLGGHAFHFDPMPAAWAERIVFDEASGSLHFDDDGSSIMAARLIASLGAATTMELQDLWMS